MDEYTEKAVRIVKLAQCTVITDEEASYVIEVLKNLDNLANSYAAIKRRSHCGGTRREIAHEPL